MKTRTTQFQTLFIALAFLMIHSSFTPLGRELNFKNMTYKIRPTSVLEVNGKTNVNSFCCTSRERLSDGAINYQFKPGTSFISFEKTSLKLEIEQLDCGAKIMNKDLHKALLADQYPNIIIDLKKVVSLNCEDLSACDSWGEFEADTDITITCETQAVKIPIRVNKLGEKSYRIIGKTAIRLCDFAITAPTAMMGLIKVKDTIEINFDLYVDVD